MYVNVRVRRARTRVFIAFGPFDTEVYVPEHDTVLSRDDVVSVDRREDGTATVYIKHHPSETWVLLREQ